MIFKKLTRFFFFWMAFILILGRYTRMMTVLVSISDSIHDFITQLLDVYVYIIFHYFTQDGVSTLLQRFLRKNKNQIKPTPETIQR